MIFERKRVIGELEGSLTGAPKYDTNPVVLAVDLEENSDKYITAVTKVSKIIESSYDIEIDL